MRRFYAFLIGLFLLATLLSVFGQGIATFLNEYFVPIAPVYYLTGLTVFSIVLYLATGLLLFRSVKKRESDAGNLEAYVVLLSIAAINASVWSIFVTAMWWG